MLPTPKEHNERFREAHDFDKSLAPVRCPICATRMLFKDGSVYYTNPAQKDAKCPECDHEDRIYIH